MYAVEVFAPTGDRTGEGALWSAAENAVYWVDINRFLVHRADFTTHAVRSWLFDEPVTATALTDRSGTLLLALSSRLVLWRPSDDSRMDRGFALPDFPAARFNDGRPDPVGNFWIGSMGNNVGPDGEGGEVSEGLGRLYCVSPNGVATEQRSGIGIANTLCWSPDATCFYSADTLANVIRVYDYDRSSGSIWGERSFFSGFERGSPDGSAMDRAGYLWNARYGGACVVRIAPDGAIDRIVEVPSQAVTTCTFGGPDLKTLFITTGTNDRAPGQRLAGSLFTLRVDVPGLPENVARID